MLDQQSGAYLSKCLSICHLPLHIIEKICKDLIESDRPVKYFGQGIACVLNLRATCSYLDQLIRSLPLQISFVIATSDIPISENDKIFKFMQEISQNFNWKIDRLQIYQHHLRGSLCDRVSVFTENYADIFSGSLHSVELNYISNISDADAVLNHLRQFALNTQTIVEIRCQSANWPKQHRMSGLCAEYVRLLTIELSYNFGLKLDVLVQSFVNLTDLRLHCNVNVNLHGLLPLKFLENLVIRDYAEIDEAASVGVVLSVLKSFEFDLGEFKREYKPIEDMSFIKNHFPSLLKTRIWKSGLWYDNGSVFNLPDLCKSLCLHRTALLTSLGNCCIENLCLYFGDLIENIEDSKFSALDLKVLIFGKFYYADVHQILINLLELLKFQPNLEYLKFDVTDSKLEDEADIERIRLWLFDNFLFFKLHKSLKAIIIGNLVLSFTHSSIWQKEWVFMSNFDLTHNNYPVQLKPRNPVFIDIASKLNFK